MYLSTKSMGHLCTLPKICVEETGKCGLSLKEKLVGKEGSMPAVGKEARRKGLVP